MRSYLLNFVRLFFCFIPRIKRLQQISFPFEKVKSFCRFLPFSMIILKRDGGSGGEGGKGNKARVSS